MKEITPIFKVNKMVCSYQGSQKEILRIEDLKIHRSKITIVLGKSGIGKSTFIESLGLMNNTINAESDVSFSPSKETIDYNDLWTAANDNVIAEIRKAYFSFIFQSTDLMDNFSVYENACLTAMIQGASYENAMGKTQRYFKQLGLEGIDLQQKAFELSGGQKQRVAFARAIVPDFEVLFADEPTGNLDQHSANNLMSILSKEIETNKQTAIIVTHNIDLALKFADVILIISNKSNSNTGEIIPNNQYVKQKAGQYWKSALGDVFENRKLTEIFRINNK